MSDQVIFDAILAAISDQSLSGGATMISVKKFIETFNNHRDRALCTSLSVAKAAVDRDELVGILTDMSSVNMSSEAAGRQAKRMADALIAKGFGGIGAKDPFMEDYKRDTVNGMAHRIHELEAALQAIAQNARHEAFMEAAAIAQRWADEAAEFHDARSETMQNVCRNLAQAIRNQEPVNTIAGDRTITGSSDA